MTQVVLNYERDSAEGDKPNDAPSVLLIKPIFRREEGQQTVVTDRPFSVSVPEDGEVLFELQPTGINWCYRIVESSIGGDFVRHVMVPDSGPVGYNELVDVDPDTFLPNHDLDVIAAWEESLALGMSYRDSTEQFSEQASASAESADGSADLALSAAESADASASLATSKAADASTSAQEANESAGSASSSATTATSKAEEASTSATIASDSAFSAANSAGNASTSEDTASTKASEASASATAAAGSASDASDFATEANTARNGAEGARDTAVTAKNDAVTAKGAAEAARDVALAQTFAGTALGTSDLNTITTPGVYYQSGGSNVLAERNYPPETVSATDNSYKAGSLEVRRWGSGVLVVQEYRTVGSPTVPSQVTYVRSQRSAGVWSPWSRYLPHRIDKTAGLALYLRDDVASRDQLIYGDTGQRDITALVPSGALDAGNTGTLLLSRRNDVVTVEFNNLLLAPGNGSVVLTSTLPAEFRPRQGRAHGVVSLLTNASQFQEVCMVSGVLYWLGQRGSTSAANTNRPTLGLAGGFSYPVEYGRAWPTTLPGTAVGTIPNA